MTNSDKISLNVDDYFAIARNVKRVLNMSEDARYRIIDRFNNEFSPEVVSFVADLPLKMCYDRRFFREADLSYANGPPFTGCFVTAIADYLLRNPDCVCLENLFES